MDELEFELYKKEVEKMNLIFTRNQELNKSDKYLLSDFPITPDNLIKIKEYRQALRDFTNNNYILPEKPDFIS